MDGTEAYGTAVRGERAAARAELVRSLVVLLILAGVGLGVLASKALSERRQKLAAVADNQNLRRLVALAESRHGEILNFLGRPGTQLVKLTGVREWMGQAMTIAWNPTQRRAMVLIERLPDPAVGMTYRLRAVSTDGRAMPVGVINPAAPSAEVFTVGTEVDGPAGFDVSLDPREGAGEGGGAGHVVFEAVKT